MTWTVSVISDRYVILDDDGTPIATLDDARFPGCAEPNRSRAEAVCEAMEYLHDRFEWTGQNRPGEILRKAGWRR